MCVGGVSRVYKINTSFCGRLLYAFISFRVSLVFVVRSVVVCLGRSFNNEGDSFFFI